MSDEALTPDAESMSHLPARQTMIALEGKDLMRGGSGQPVDRRRAIEWAPPGLVASDLAR
ncbi:hypothetical protein [Actinomadura madurae]|uniref:hypothetical protein n=1 Tax=Actinomadura madurae TaxID=1993 RepID=UPI0020D2564F|nr:hypothetical protein [Actinomadura madurae]MCP9949086.1 hypothetical protein [Actinomadura madurae]MCP9965848.1 hypothetical protein [Actinomadura madurae]MCP9978327.1 hypothetical protein [Actinomadura madurae]MCQ0010152.1 hypothetical protein [Actinomadura madurae]